MKIIVLKIVIFFMRIIYFFMKLFKTKNQITMISRQSNEITLDFKLLKEEIEKDKKYKVIILCKKLEGKENAKITEEIKYFFHMFKQMYCIATSKVVVLDSYCIAIGVLKHKKSLKVLQMWHSIGTMKKFGYDILDQEEGNSSLIAKTLKMHKNYDVVLCAGEGYKDDLARQFNCNEKCIKIIPLPRVDLLYNVKYLLKIKSLIFIKYPILKEKLNIVYCPTFRKNESLFQKNIELLINSVNFNKYNLIIKLHPLSKVKITNKNVILDISFSSIDMISISDYVITDYSCILYEAGILKKPIYFYCFDYEEYNKNRSLNIDYYNELPGVVSKNIDDIINSIEHEKYDYNKLDLFIKKYVDEEKECSKKIYNLIKTMK